MSEINDDSGVSPSSGTPAFNDRQVEALLSGHGAAIDPELATALSTMRSMGAVQAPAPSFALERMLTGGLTPEAVVPALTRKPQNRRRIAVRSAAVFAGLSAALVGAASANALPGPAQNVVARIIETVTPATVPHGHRHHQTPNPVVIPVSTPSLAPSPPAGPDQTTGPDEVTGTDHSTGAEHSAEPQDRQHSPEPATSNEHGGDGASSEPTTSTEHSGSKGKGSGSGSGDSRHSGESPQPTATETPDDHGGSEVAPTPTPDSNGHDTSGSNTSSEPN